MITIKNVLKKLSRTACGTLLAMGAVGPLSGCVGAELYGFELGPDVGNDLVIGGVLPPTNSGTGCSFAANSFGSAQNIYLAGGEMEFGPVGQEATGTYTAALEVQNKMLQPQPQQNQQGSYQGRFGSTNTNDITIVAGNVRYEYPDLAVNQNTAAGLIHRPGSTRELNVDQRSLFQNPSGATGRVGPSSNGVILINLVTPQLFDALVQDEDVKARLASTDNFPAFTVIAYVSLEGRTNGGGRVTTNEVGFRITMSRGVIRNCERLDEACDAAAAAGTRAQAVRNNQCFKDQDFRECSPTACAVVP